MENFDDVTGKFTYGGIGRIAFCAFTIGGLLIVGFLTALIPQVNEGLLPLVFASIILLVTAFFRMKNIGKSPWLSLLIFVPFGNFVLLAWGMILPEGYQDIQELDTSGKIVGVLLLICVVLIFVVWFAG